MIDESEYVDETVIAEIQTQILDKVDVHCRERLSPHIMQTLSVDVWVDELSGGLCAQIDAFLYGVKVHEGEEYVSFNVPLNWWEHLKQQCFPEWLKKRFPVKLDMKTKTVRFEQINTYPFSPVITGDYIAFTRAIHRF